MNPATNHVSPSADRSIPIVIALGEPARALGVHPAAELFPLMKGPEFGLLVEDIGEHGLREPIVICQGVVLDGRNRLRACEIAGVEPRFVEWDGIGSPLGFVLARNLHRRHLNEGQRALIAAQAKAMFEEEAAARERAGQFGLLCRSESSRLTRANKGARPGQAQGRLQVINWTRPLVCPWYVPRPLRRRSPCGTLSSAGFWPLHAPRKSATCPESQPGGA